MACYVNEDRVAFSTPPWHGACEVRFHGGDKVYCPRGEAGNRIKETQPDLFGTRSSCHKFLANWLRSLLAGRACTLMQGLKRLAPRDTERATATSATIRARLL